MGRSKYIPAAMKILKCQNNRAVWGHIVVTFGLQSLGSIRGRVSRKDAGRYLL